MCRCRASPSIQCFSLMIYKETSEVTFLELKNWLLRSLQMFLAQVTNNFMVVEHRFLSRFAHELEVDGDVVLIISVVVSVSVRVVQDAPVVAADGEGRGLDELAGVDVSWRSRRRACTAPLRLAPRHRLPCWPLG
uniref:Uncharacterized protein n=1 Tax=Arundo donax TaxID=35708 RepID=A0A0A9BZB6_ARUDO